MYSSSQEKSTKNFFKINDEKKSTIKSIFKEIFKLFIIEIDFNKDFNYENPKYKFGENKIVLPYLFDDVVYNEDDYQEKNYKRYLMFIEKIKQYIKKVSNEIKYEGKIILELTEEPNEQTDEDNEDIKYVKCIYKIEDNNEIQFRDDNVLIDGFDGKRQGFLFLINELCNDDYDND